MGSSPAGSDAATSARAVSSMSAHMLTRSAGASARKRSRTRFSNSGVVSFIEAFLQRAGNTQIGRPATKIAEVRASRKQRAHVAKLQLRCRRLGPDELGKNQVLPRRDPGVETGEAHAPAPLEFVAPERLVLAHDEIELHQLFKMKDVEHAALAQRALHVSLRDVVLRLEECGKPLGVAAGAFDNEIDVARHARLRVITEGERAGEHVGDAFALEPRERVLQD